MSHDLSKTDVFVLLAKRRRRLLLRILQESTTPLTLVGIARRIGKREYENPTDRDVRIIKLSLYHNHLPKLERADVVVFDEDVGIVRPWVNFDTLVRVLENVDEQDLSWSDG